MAIATLDLIQVILFSYAYK